MSKNLMQPRERVLTALNWLETDRVPLQIYTTPEIRQKLQDLFGREDFLPALGIDLRKVMPNWTRPLKPSCDGIFYDFWGVGYRRVAHGRNGAYDEAVELPLARIKTMDDVFNYSWPDPAGFDYDGLRRQCQQVDDYAICLGSPGYPDILNGVSRGRGMEQVMMDIALRDEVGLAIIQKRCDICYEILKRGLEACNGRVDILHVGEDCGNQNGRMFSAADFDAIFRPQLKRFYDLAHEFGARAMMHSCGDTHELMPTFIEMGLDILDGMQPEPTGMQPEAIRALCKGKLAFCGLISTQDTLPYGTEDRCRQETRHRLEKIAPGGGYILSPAHCIQPDTPLNNILAVYEEVLAGNLLRLTTSI